MAGRDEGIDSFVATPGRQMWFIGSDRGRGGLNCDAGCLPVDPNYRPDPGSQIKPHYTLREPRRIERN